MAYPQRSAAQACPAAPAVPEHEIWTSLLYLRAIREDDLDDYVTLVSDPEVMRHVGVDAGEIPSKDEMRSLVENAVKAWQARGYGRWSLFDRTTGAFVGFCGFRCQDDIPEILCLVHKAYWGSGAAYEAATACLSYGYDQLGFTEVRSHTRPDNHRALGLLAKLGAEYLGNIDFHGVEAAAHQLGRPAL